MDPTTRRSPPRVAWPVSDALDWPDEVDRSEPAAPRILGVLYDADGHDRPIDLSRDPPPVSERQLLWVDFQGSVGAELDRLCSALELPPSICAVLKSRSARTQFIRGEGFYHLGIPALDVTSKEDWKPVWVRFVWSARVLITIHSHEVDAFDRFRDQEAGETQIGALSGAILCAALLDWHLASYFKAIEALERAVDRFDESVLMRSARDGLVQDLLRMRRRTSRMRRLLSPQREVFHALTRPDLTEEVGASESAHFITLGARFERTREALEHATDLVHGAFALHASRTAESVNDFLKTLTFGTFLLGAMGVVAGIMGMNFETHLFASGEKGFWGVIAGLGTVALGALIVARRRRWI